MSALKPNPADVQLLGDVEQFSYVLAGIAERVLPEGDPDRELLVAIGRAVERVYDAVEAEQVAK
jgi:hypothetical protein